MALPKLEQAAKKEYPKHRKGMHQIALADVIFLGKRIAKSFKKDDRYPQPRLALVFQSMDCEPGTAERFQLASEFTYTPKETGNLYKFLTPWLGPFANEGEVIAAIEGLESRIGTNVLANIVHEPWKSDPSKISVNIASVGPLMDKMEPFKVAAYQRRPFWQKKIDQYAADYAAFMAEQPKKEEAKAQSFADFPKGLEDSGEDAGLGLPY